MAYGLKASSCDPLIKSNNMFCWFSLYRTVQKGNQGAGQNRECIGAYHVVHIPL